MAAHDGTAAPRGDATAKASALRASGHMLLRGDSYRISLGCTLIKRTTLVKALACNVIGIHSYPPPLTPR